MTAMRTILTWVLAAMLAACAACETEAVPPIALEPVRHALRAAWPHNRAVNIVAFGHSVPAGYTQAPRVEPFDAYPHLLHRALAARYPTAVINVHVAAVGGEDSSAGLARFQRDVLAMQPDVVLIDYALNDRRLGVDQARANLTAMVDQAHAAGTAVVLLTPTPDAQGDADALAAQAQMIRALAQARGVALADSAAAFARHGDVARLMATFNHPARAGHALVTATLMDVLAP